MASQKDTQQTSQRSQGSDLSSLFTDNNPDLQTLALARQMAALNKQPEHQKDRDARINRETADAKIDRFQRITLFCVTLFTPIIALGVCFWIILSNSFTEEIKQWAKQLVFPIITGFMGFVLGKTFKDKG